jgi:large subunit ribosomal protein L25
VSEVNITATLRTEFGKGAARRTRRAGLVPAVVYGHGEAPRHISLPGHELMLALKSKTVLLEIELPTGKELALPKSVVRDPIKGTLEHVDLVLVNRGEKVAVDIPVHTTGTSDRDGIIEHVNNSVEVRAEATAIPTELLINIEGLRVGESVFAKDVILPAGVELLSSEEMVIIRIAGRPTADAGSTEAEAAEATEAPATPAAAEPAE